MSDAERDPMVGRAIDELRRLPPVDEAAVRRVVAAAAAVRVTPAGEDVLVAKPARRRLSAWSIVAIGEAAVVVGFLIYGRGPAAPAAIVDTSATVPPLASSASARPASLGEGDALPIPHQFVFNGRALHVAVVGDFNQWNPSSAPMTRSSDGELWSVTIPVLPGRHMYGFMVDDSLLVLDPREPKARDPYLGAEGSIIIVGRP
ncbi:MAG: hypothetical protein ACREMU_13395 [Gemmatimonadaceae bacterium]